MTNTINMGEKITPVMEIVDVAKDVMISLNIEPLIHSNSWWYRWFTTFLYGNANTKRIYWWRKLSREI